MAVTVYVVVAMCGYSWDYSERTVAVFTDRFRANEWARLAGERAVALNDDAEYEVRPCPMDPSLQEAGK